MRDARQPDLFVAGDEVITLEGAPGSDAVRAVVRGADGAARPLSLPPRADPRPLAVAGDLAAASIRHSPDLDRAVVVVDPHTGAELRRVRFDFRAPVLALAVGTDGSIAFSSELGGIGQVLFWSPAGSDGFAVFDHSAQPDGIALAGRRVAIVDRPIEANAQRVSVLELPAALPADRNRLYRAGVLFRGPAHAAVDSLSFDGDQVAWASEYCQLVARVEAGSRYSVPRGPCLRTEIDTTEFHGGWAERSIGRGRIPVKVTCISGPRRRCRVRALAIGQTTSAFLVGNLLAVPLLAAVRTPPASRPPWCPRDGRPHARSLRTAAGLPLDLLRRRAARPQQPDSPRRSPASRWSALISSSS